ncbi:MAG: HTH domain-containing protein [Candidatus Heimdallarchaeota archaeon]|nr:HTH domain-containing protein [Candidatus Heimdallarchaeota archaeon]
MVSLVKKENVILSLLDPKSTRFKILESLSKNGKEASSQEISEKIAVTEKTVRNNLTYLKKLKLVKKESRDSYSPIPGLYPIIVLMQELDKKIEEITE